MLFGIKNIIFLENIIIIKFIKHLLGRILSSKLNYYIYLFNSLKIINKLKYSI